MSAPESVGERLNLKLATMPGEMLTIKAFGHGESGAVALYDNNGHEIVRIFPGGHIEVVPD